MMQQLIADSEEKMKKTIASLQKELVTIRTGRASPALLDRIEADYYGTPTSIKQMASVSVPDARTLLISPFEKKSLGTIEKALMKSDLGITPNNDGIVLRLIFPAPTEERRKELVKVAKKHAEETKIAIRNIRRDENEKIKALEKKSDLTQDDSKKLQEQLQKLTDRYINETEQVLSGKEAEIMEV
ncbi:MAG TPA: ribosome recycling factor [Cyanobacteria bacterium UBA8530]|nr:ribosome recycling factor [Cyanobacteria bacterium UBA8530]